MKQIRDEVRFKQPLVTRGAQEAMFDIGIKPASQKAITTTHPKSNAIHADAMRCDLKQISTCSFRVACSLITLSHGVMICHHCAMCNKSGTSVLGAATIN